MAMCEVEGCSKQSVSRELCRMHYSRMRRGKPMTAGPLRVPRECSVEGCDIQVATSLDEALCKRHKFRRGTGDYSPVQSQEYGPTCTFKGCDKPHRSRGFCTAHYAQWRRDPDDMYPLHSRTPDAGSYVSAQGYVLIWKPDHPTAHKSGYMLEHRYVMEQMLGRSLYEDENVHHKNGKRDDNRPANLELWTTMQPSGKRVDDLVKYAREILKRYDKPKLLRKVS
jgi:hypothetical protein